MTSAEFVPPTVSGTPSAPRRVVCLILEGTYPYVSGGVSTWVHQIIGAMPDFDFAVHFIGDKKQHNAEFKYELPGNISSLTESYLFDVLGDEQLRPGTASRKEKAEFVERINALLVSPGIEEKSEVLFEMAYLLRQDPSFFTLSDLLTEESIWELLIRIYQEQAGRVPLLRYHSTVRDLATLLWRLTLTAGTLPRADIYHCVCTGYAGFLGAVASRLHNVPLLLSEHGVYLKERIEDIRKSMWLAGTHSSERPTAFDGEIGTFKALWIDFFDLLGRLAYERSECITALYQGNARLQREFGASKEKLAIIPNGIDTSRFTDICREKLSKNPDPLETVTVGFLGRVVPIKDVKTLLRAARLVANQYRNVRFLVAGPTDEDPEYFFECKALTEQLGLEEIVDFAGRMNPADFLRKSDIMLLTSISEGLPFAILEASAAGLPVVATDVGSCRELITYPIDGDDSFGPSGLVSEVANPGSTAAALNQLVGSAELRRELGRNGLKRVEAGYRQEEIIARYRQLYLAPASRGMRQQAS